MEGQKQAYVYAGFVIAFWSTVASAFKISLRYVDVFHLLLYSALTSLIVLFMILIAQKKTYLLRELSRRDYLHSAILGFLNPFLYYIVLFGAYSLLQAQEAQPLNQIWIILLPLLSIVVLGQKLKAKNIVALVIGFIGVLIISTHGDPLGLRFTSLPGVLLALGSALIWSLYWTYNVKDRRDEVVKLFLNFAFGFVPILVMTALFSQIPFSNINGLFGAIYIGVFEMGITFVLWLSALRLSRTTAEVSSLIYLVPFFSLIVIQISVGEQIMVSTIIGLLFIIAGILIQQHSGSPRPGKQNPSDAAK